MGPTRTEVLRAAVTGSLLLAAWTAWTCPCSEPLLSCHLPEFLLAAVGPAAAVWLNVYALGGALG
jgi:hypothetical protein